MLCLARMRIFYGILLAIAPCIQAQTPQPQIFEWGFLGAQFVSTSLPSCRVLSLEADARSANGTPPFFMMAFAVDGTPSTSFIGTNQSNLTWTVSYPVGTQLVLGVVDSLGHSGGIAPPVYTVTDGATTQCVPATPPEPGFKISANVTDVLETCQPWGLTIEGGTPPYNVTIAQMNSGNITNVTLGPIDTVFTYINRMEPGYQLIASASDMNGNWATGSPFVHTQGSSDIDCPGLDSISQPASSADTNTTSKFSHKKIGITVGATVGGLLLLLCCAIIIRAVVRRRRRNVERPDLRTTNVITPFSVPMVEHNGPAGTHLIGFPSNFHSTNPNSRGRGSSKHAIITSGSTSTDEPPSSPPRPSRGRGNSKNTTITSESTSTEESPPSPPQSSVIVVRELPPPYPNWLR
ncbi:hypothetical protein K438DRAFT_1863063 [Mycena galopus ATCC 62051]|nr:hypothetical protein K438DRAFT_1863063 [Mycena galopus ATCC 62051]